MPAAAIKRKHTSWFAIQCKAFAGPQLSMARGELGRISDLHYVYAHAWCKQYAQNGQLRDWWPALAEHVGFEYGWEALRDLWRKCCIVVGPMDEIFDWYETNGWILRDQIGRAESMAALRASRSTAGKKSGKARRIKAKQLRLKLASEAKAAAQLALPRTRKARPKRTPATEKPPNVV